MAKRGENIYRRKDGRYEGRYVIGRTEQGRTRFGYIYARSYREARRLLLQKKLERMGRATPARRIGGGSLEDWLEYWLVVCVKPRVRPSTYANYQNVTRHIRLGLGDVPMESLDSTRILAFTNSETLQALAHSTRRSVLRLLESALKAAVKEGVIVNNPMSGIQLKSPCGMQQRVLTLDEQRRLTSKALKLGALPELIGLYAGLRIGEVCGLRWEDVRWSEGAIAVHRTIQRLPNENARDGRESRTKVVVCKTKSAASERLVPVPDFLLKALRHRYHEWKRCDGGSNDYICCSDCRKGGFHEPRAIQYRFAGLLKEAGIAGAHFHTLRHTYATRLLEAGMDLKTVSELLGHSSPQITLSVYAHATLEQKRRAAKLLEEYSA